MTTSLPGPSNGREQEARAAFYRAYRRFAFACFLVALAVFIATVIVRLAS